MSCERPLLVLNPRYKGLTDKDKKAWAQEIFGLDKLPDEYIEVPCGSCIGCEKSRQYEYSIRLQYELDASPPNSCLFVTLTFDDEHLEMYKDDLNKPVLRFLDVLRKRYGKSIRRWFVCEFGTLHGRPHYHGILFNCPREMIDCFTENKIGYHKIITPLWKCGISFTGYVNEKTCKYVAKYVTKSLSNGIKRPRLISSFGIGKKYIDDCAKLHKSGNGDLDPLMTIAGKPFPIPRYYHTKIFNSYDKKQLALEKYKHPKYYWQGTEYKSKEERDRARAQTYSRNLREGLTKSKAIKREKRKFKQSILQTKDFKTEFDL